MQKFSFLGFYPSSYHQPFNGNQMYPPEFGFASNAQYYPMHQPTEFYYEQSFSPGKREKVCSLKVVLQPEKHTGVEEFLNIK